MKHKNACKIVAEYFYERGFHVLPIKESQANGPDVTVVGQDLVATIEVKTLSKKKSGSWQAKPIERCRKNDGFVAIVHDNEIILIEPMAEYLKLCSKSGLRTFTELVALYSIESFGIMK